MPRPKDENVSKIFISRTRGNIICIKICWLDMNICIFRCVTCQCNCLLLLIAKLSTFYIFYVCAIKTAFAQLQFSDCFVISMQMFFFSTYKNTLSTLICFYDIYRVREQWNMLYAMEARCRIYQLDLRTKGQVDLLVRKFIIYYSFNLNCGFSYQIQMVSYLLSQGFYVLCMSTYSMCAICAVFWIIIIPCQLIKLRNRF